MNTKRIISYMTMMLLAVSLNAQIIYQIGDKRAEIVPKITYDTAIALSVNQMDKIMIELLKCDSIAETSKISDLQLSKCNSLVIEQANQINTCKAAISTSNEFIKVMQTEVKEVILQSEETNTKLIRTKNIAIVSSIVALIELIFVL